MTEDLQKGLREIPACEILDKIQTGEPVEYDHVIIKGDLNLNELNLPTEHVVLTEFQAKTLMLFEESIVVTSPIIFTNSKFDGNLNFSDHLFKNPIEIKYTEFGGEALFIGAIFNGKTDFSGAIFGRVARFWGATFSEKADFSKITFGEMANFRGAIFSREARFWGATFRKDSDFEKATFNGEANFIRSRFDDIANFNATFSGVLDLEESKIYSMHLSNAIFENTSIISLRFSDFVRLEIRWKSIRDKIKYDGSAYLALVRNFNSLELFNDADECYYQYRTVRRKENLNGIITKLLDYVAWIAYGYGVRPGNPLILSLGLFLISIFVFVSGFGLQNPLGSMINATYLSVFVFTSSPKTDPLTGLYGIWGMIERIAGWLLMACFLVVLAKKTLR